MLIRKNNLIAAILICGILLAYAPAFADELHYNNMLIGERPSGMGGAYTAISDDTSGLFYNPAGVAYSRGGNLSASVNAYHNSQKKYKNVIGGFGWTRKSTSIVPNFFGIVQSLGKGKIGFSYAITDSVLEDQDQTFANFTGCRNISTTDTITDGTKTCTINHAAINVNTEENVTNLGPTYAREIVKDLSAGVTLYLHQRRKQEIINQFIIRKQDITDATYGTAGSSYYELSNSNKEIEELGIRPIAGLMWSPFKKVAVGLSASRTLLLSSTTTTQQILDNGAFTLRQESETADTSEYPWASSLGVAYFASDSLLLSGDFSYNTKVKSAKYTFDLDQFDITSGSFVKSVFVDQSSSFQEKEATWNAALGAEYFIVDSIALRAGAFTNRANSPEPEKGVTQGLEHIDYIGGSGSASYFSRNSSLTLGGIYSRGTGTAQVMDDGTHPVQDAEASAWALFISSTYVY